MPLTTKRLATKDMVPVCRQIATAYEAGIPIREVLSSVGAQQKNREVREILLRMSTDIQAGNSLGEAATKYSEQLSPFFVGLLANGEQSGRLDTMLSELADYYEDRLAMRRQVVGALTYPAFLLVICWFLGTFAIGIVNVALAGMDGSGGGISGVTQYFKDYAAFQTRAMIVFAVLAVIGVVLSRLGALKWITGMVTTFVWPLSGITKKLGMARFFRSFSMMLSSGISLPICIQKSAELTANPYIQNDLMKAIPPVREGMTLVEAFNHCSLMTPLAREMLAVGEQSGNLELQLNKAATYHMDEARHLMKQATTIFTTMIMLGVFTLIGAVVIYFWTNLYGGMMDGLGI